MSISRSFVRKFYRMAAALFAVVLVAGCGDDQIVYRDRAAFNAPKDSAAGFLGYYTVATKQTTCGNCHASYQASWKTTKHASAYKTLNDNPGKQASCFGCHTISGNGNSLSGTIAGHDKVNDSTYFDVQCESCHGPGLKHVEGVGSGSIVRPLAKLSVAGKGTCADCHTGTHNPFAEEWAQSGHAKIESHALTCGPSCHDGRGALVAWGINANYVEKADASNQQGVTCAVCHNPHGSSNPAQLRFSVTSPDPEQNLCMKCHMRRNEPSFTQSAPHAPQGAVLLGLAGWRPPGFVYDTARIYGSHATTANPKLCAGCHVSRFTVTDKATGAFTFQATGHLMRPTPCIDATGKPTSSKTCDYTTAARSFQSCATSGCHASQAVAAAAFTTVRSRMQYYTDQLWRDLNANGSIQAAPTDAGLLPTIRQTRPNEWSTTDNTITPAEGAEFNARLCGEFGQSNSDNSKGIHNPFLCEALLLSTINYVRTYYNLPAASQAEQAMLNGPIGGEFNGGMKISRTAPR